MSERKHEQRGLLFSLGLAVVLICVCTAIACGAIIFLSDVGAAGGRAQSTDSAEFSAVGKTYDSLSAARAAADEARDAGRAGYVSAETEGFFLVYAVYSSAADADTVADRLGAATLDVAVRSTEPAAQSDADAFDALLETAERAETLWRELDAGETSESLVAVTLEEWSTALGRYATEDAELTSLVTRTRTSLVTATSGEHSLTSEVKYLSAQLVFALSAMSEGA